MQEPKVKQVTTVPGRTLVISNIEDTGMSMLTTDEYELRSTDIKVSTLSHKQIQGIWRECAVVILHCKVTYSESKALLPARGTPNPSWNKRSNASSREYNSPFTVKA